MFKIAQLQAWREPNDMYLYIAGSFLLSYRPSPILHSVSKRREETKIYLTISMFHPRHCVINKEKNRTVKKLANKLEKKIEQREKKMSENTPKKFIVYKFDHIKHKLHITDGSMLKKIKDGFRGKRVYGMYFVRYFF